MTEKHTFAFTTDELERINSALCSQRFTASVRLDHLGDRDIEFHGSLEKAEEHWVNVLFECDSIMDMINPFLDELDFQENWLKDSLDDSRIEKFLGEGA